MHQRLLCLICLVLSFVAGCSPRSASNSATTQPWTDCRIATTERPDLLQEVLTYDSGQDGGQNTILESLGGGVGVFDLENDGRPDLAFALGGNISTDGISGHGCQVLRKTFENYHDVTAIALIGSDHHYTHGVEVTDVDNDGFDDLLVSGYGGVTAWHNLGDGTLERRMDTGELDAGHWSTSMAAADFNQDGFSDLYVCHYVNWSTANNPVCIGAKGVPDVCPPRVFEAVDDSLYLNSGDGRLLPASGQIGLVSGGKGLGVLAADLDADGDTDIYVANDTTENFLYRNDAGRLHEIGLASGAALDNLANANGSMGVAVLDADGDGCADIFVANYEDEVFGLYRGLGALSYVYGSDQFGISSLGNLFVGFGAVAVDLDLDGDEDMVVANGHVVHVPENAPLLQQPLLLWNSGIFQRVQNSANSYFLSAQMGRGLVRLDFNEDGRPDLLFCNSDAPSGLVENSSTSTGRSLEFLLSGRISDRRCSGARVSVTLHSGRIMLRNVCGGSSYLSQSEASLHFGIPAGESVSHVTFHWPGGSSVSVRPCDFGGNIEDNARYRVIQSTGLIDAPRIVRVR